ncbi:MAG: cytochrome C, partial [Acinetobacter sp.]
LIHKNARLSKAEQDLILNWIEETKDSLSKN